MLNYIGFVNYNLDNVDAAMAAYEEMIRIPSIEEQIKKQTIYTMSQLSTMQEKYDQALKFLDEFFVLETNPAPDAYILYAQNLYQVNRYPDMIAPINQELRRQSAVKWK